MKIALFVLLLVFSGAPGCQRQARPPLPYSSENLKIERLTGNTFVHISYLEIPNYGPFPCNGLIYADGKEAVVLDTPTNDAASAELLRWVENSLQCKVVAVVVNHFHIDCLGGLAPFHQQHIPSFANRATIERARGEGAELPLHGFDTLQELAVGKQTVVNRFFGPGHTADNLVSYLPAENLLFGGCLIKEVGAGKGNLQDAIVGEWSATVRKVQAAYPNLRYVVPGHGRAGGTELLDYTIGLFAEE